MSRRTAKAASLTPRATTFAMDRVSSRRWMLIATNTSGLTSGLPSGPAATWGEAAMMRAVSRLIPLESSASAPRRSTSTLSGEPVRTSAARNPLASASMAMNTATTMPTPRAVIAVDTGRWSTLRTL